MGQREHMGVYFEGLEPFFVLDPKAMFFVDNNEAQVSKFYVPRKQAMGANDDVYFALLDLF